MTDQESPAPEPVEVTPDELTESEYPCCSEYKCRRKQPIEIQRGGFSGVWYAITRYKRSGEDGRRIEALEKHALDPFLSVALDYALEHKAEVTALYEQRMDALDKARAERDAGGPR